MKPPLSVVLISCLYIVAGTSGIIYHFSELNDIAKYPEMILVFVIRLLAIVGGVFAFRRMSWARWLLIIWIAYHVILSVSHDVGQLVVHLLFMILTIYALFNPKASLYFRKS